MWCNFVAQTLKVPLEWELSKALIINRTEKMKQKKSTTKTKTQRSKYKKQIITRIKLETTTIA